jgi:hypothetical protein
MHGITAHGLRRVGAEISSSDLLQDLPALAPEF